MAKPSGGCLDEFPAFNFGWIPAFAGMTPQEEDLVAPSASSLVTVLSV
jgi:hypothetical protein